MLFKGGIILVNRSYLCGHYRDLNIFKRKLSHLLGQMEQITADSGYNHPRWVNRASFLSPWRALYKEIRARMKLSTAAKNIFVFSWTEFMHNANLYVHCFNAVAQLTLILIPNCNTIFIISIYTISWSRCQSCRISLIINSEESTSSIHWIFIYYSTLSSKEIA